MIPDWHWGVTEWLEVAVSCAWLVVVIWMLWESTEHHCAHCSKKVNRRHM